MSWIFAFSTTFVTVFYTGSALKNTDSWFLTKTCPSSRTMSFVLKTKLPGALTKAGFTILPWNFSHIAFVAIHKTCVWDFFCFVFALFS